MPVLERGQDGDYFIRAYLRSQECIVTWQVRGSGVSYLNKRGIYDGQSFSLRLLQELKRANLIFTGGSGIQPGSVRKPRKKVTFPAKKTTCLETPYLSAYIARKSKGNTKRQTVVRSATSLVFRKYKKRWELLIIFPKIFIESSKLRLFMSSCCLTVVGATSTLKTKQFLPDRGEAFLPVVPQKVDYIIQLNGSDSSVMSLMEVLNRVISDVKGLNPSGTVFKVNNEISSWKEGTRLNKQVPMFLGRSYFVIFHSSHKPKMLPPTVKIKNLGNTGMWEAWEIQMPTEATTDLVNWCASLGHVLLNEQ